MNNTTSNTPEMNTTSEIPNTPGELIKNNTHTTPEELWERFKDLSVKEKELFIWNTCDWMKSFHNYMVESMMEDDEMGKDDVGIWIQDGTKWCEIMRTLGSMS